MHHLFLKAYIFLSIIFCKYSFLSHIGIKKIKRILLCLSSDDFQNISKIVNEIFYKATMYEQ